MLIELLLASTLGAALLTALAPEEYADRLALALSLVPVAISLYMYAVFDGAGNALLEGGQLAFRTQVDWLALGPYQLRYYVGLDGISMPLVLLATVLTTLAILSAWTPIDERRSMFYALMFVMETSLVGVFAALDFFVWFVFWEAVLVPMYLLIGVWGGPRRKYAAIKFFVYTNIASLVMFLGFFSLVFGLGDSISTLGLPEIAQAVNAGEVGGLLGLPAAQVKLLAFTAMFFGFAVKVPVVPFHTWLPDAHVEAPTPVSVMLAGVLLKMGTYALLRFNFTMLPDVAVGLGPILAGFAVVSVIYGALLALAQSDLKRIVAYSSVSSMGYVILGLVAYTTYGLGGATFQMISHGLISGLLFLCVGVVYNAAHTRMVGDLSGIADRMPVTVGALVAGSFAYMGLPLMAGFAAEFFVFVGAFQSTVLPSAPLFTALAMFGIVIVAGYLLWALQRTVFGTYRLDTDDDPGPAQLHDVAPLLVLVVIIVVLGTVPGVFFGMIQDAVNPLLDMEGTRAGIDPLAALLGGDP